MIITKRIKLLCDENNMSFAQLERAIDISNGQIRRWEKASPKNDNLLKIAEFFNVSLDFLNGRSDIREVIKSHKSIRPAQFKQELQNEYMNKIENGVTDMSQKKLNELLRYIEFLKWDSAQK